MDGENNGKPYFLMDDLGGNTTIFGSTSIHLLYMYMFFIHIDNKYDNICLNDVYALKVYAYFWRPDRICWTGIVGGTSSYQSGVPESITNNLYKAKHMLCRP